MVCVQCTHVEIPTSALPHHMCVEGSAPQQPQPPSGLVTVFPRHHLRPCTQQACTSPTALPCPQLTGLPCPCGLFSPALPRQAPCPPPLYWHKNEDPLSRNTHWSQLAHILEDCQQKPSQHGRLRTPAHALPCQGASAHGRLCAHQSATAPLGSRGCFPLAQKLQSHSGPGNSKAFSTIQGSATTSSPGGEKDSLSKSAPPWLLLLGPRVPLKGIFISL